MESDQVFLSEFNRKVIFRWAPKGKYASIDDIPEYVRYQELNNARSKRRIHNNLCCMLFGFTCAVAAIVYGKYRQRHGMETLEEYNIRKHKESREEALNETKKTA